LLLDLLVVGGFGRSLLCQAPIVGRVSDGIDRGITKTMVGRGIRCPNGTTVLHGRLPDSGL